MTRAKGDKECWGGAPDAKSNPLIGAKKMIVKGMWRREELRLGHLNTEREGIRRSRGWKWDLDKKSSAETVWAEPENRFTQQILGRGNCGTNLFAVVETSEGDQRGEIKRRR